jgi:hypothetical protein
MKHITRCGTDRDVVLVANSKSLKLVLRYEGSRYGWIHFKESASPPSGIHRRPGLTLIKFSYRQVPPSFASPWQTHVDPFSVCSVDSSLYG